MAKRVVFGANAFSGQDFIDLLDDGSLSVRATNVYGARQQVFKIIPRSVIAIRQGRAIPLHGGGLAVKSYIHVRDVSEGEMAVLRHGELGRRHHLSPDGGIAVRDGLSEVVSWVEAHWEELSRAPPDYVHQA